MGRLRALQAPPEQLATLLCRVWEAGDAALVVPDAPHAEVERTLSALRATSLTTVDPSGSETSRRLDPGAGADDEVALVVATSGSTGEPKGVELGHGALQASVTTGLRRLGAAAGERWGLALPTHHVAGLAVLLRSWRLGTRPVVGTDPAALVAQGAEHLALVPTQLTRWLEAGARPGRLRSLLVGGAPVGPDLRERAATAGLPLVVSYGMSETCGGCVYDGLPLDGVEVAVDGDGRIRVRGPVLFRGYRGTATPGGPDAGGWFTTGDRGRLVDGRLEVLGRADETAVSGGENVPLAALASVLRTHPSVRDAAVTTRPDVTWGEEIVAVVVPADARRPPALDDLRSHVRRRRPAAWAPRAVVHVARLPRDAMGKVSRASLRGVVEGETPSAGDPPDGHTSA